MKKIYCFIVFSLLLIQYSQCQERYGVEVFINRFTNLKTGWDFIKADKSEISLDITRKQLGGKLINEYVSAVYPIGILEDKKNITLLIELGFPMGGYTSSYYLVTISKNGENKNYNIVGENMLEEEGGQECSIYFPNDSILEVHQFTVKYNKDGNKVITKKEYSHYKIDPCGFKAISRVTISNGRLYPDCSKRLTRPDELEGLTKGDLDLMRNEIFADHGYIFKTQKWKNYFSDKPWYTPSYDDINDKLSVIEKINIQTILEVSKNK